MINEKHLLSARASRLEAIQRAYENAELKARDALYAACDLIAREMTAKLDEEHELYYTELKRLKAEVATERDAVFAYFDKEDN